jgi:hypothetical protein
MIQSVLHIIPTDNIVVYIKCTISIYLGEYVSDVHYIYIDSNIISIEYITGLFRMCIKEYQIILSFGSLAAVLAHHELISEFTAWKVAMSVEKPTEKRGMHVKAIHALAREYRLSHPETSYRDCLKVVSKNKKTDDTIPESNNLEA